MLANVQRALTPDLLHKDFRSVRGHPMAGHCYVASEALWHLLGGYKSVWRPTFIRHEATPHWFLRGPQGAVLDPTAEQFATPVPYAEGIGKGFLTGQPSKRARIVIDRVNKTT